MGRKWKRKNKNKHSGEGKPRKDNPDWGKERDPYTTISAGNFKMEAFYAYQGVHDTYRNTETQRFEDCSDRPEDQEAERQRWLTAMKSTLPIAFRIGNDVDPDLRKQLTKELEAFVGKKIRIEVEPKGGKRREIREQQYREMEGKTEQSEAAGLPELEKEVKWISPAEPLTFIPHAYHVCIDKQTLRRNSALKDFHDWIKIQTEAGFVTRQEAVSMIPPVVLNSEPHHMVLDMAAAPGSKTSQLLEIANLPTKEDSHEPKGCVVANDSDVKRAYMLVHQTRRINSPAIFITNCDARFFPLLKDDDSSSTSEGIFDRVLADVPCTGDGTARKNPGIWKSWSALNGYALHPLQLAIALRGAQATKVGGYLCYSTCSMNPIENEAVVAALLRASEGSLELVERASELEGLVSRPGMTNWKNLCETKSAREIKNHKKKNNAKMVARRKAWEEQNQSKENAEANTKTPDNDTVEVQKQYVDNKTEFKPKSMGDKDELKQMIESTGLIEYKTHEEVPALMRKRIRPSCFPPTSEELEEFHLDRCMRIMPQDMNTGGFFVALLKKVAPLNARTRKRFENLQKYADEAPETSNRESATEESGEPVTKKVKVDSEEGDEKPKGEKNEKNKNVGNDDFLPVPEDIFKPLKEFYGLDDESFQESNYMVRSGGDGKILYFVTKTIRSMLIDRGIQDKLNTINSGVKCFTRNNKECAVNYRVSQEGVHFVAPHMKKRKLVASREDFEMCLSAPTVQCKDLSEELASQMRELSMGSFVVALEGYENNYIKKLMIVLWKCRSDCVNYLVTQTEIDGIRSKLRAIS